MFHKSVVVVSAALALFVSGCATIPSGPSVMVLPGTGKAFEQFQADDGVCRQWALEQTGTTTKKVANESTVTGAAVGTVLGGALGAAIGAAAGNPAIGAAVGAGAGLLGGTAVGASNAAGAQVSLQSRYDTAYIQCMYTKGNQVPLPPGFQVGHTPAPPASPPPAVPPNVPPPPPGTPPPPPPGH